jgi:hypothetical protein
MQTSRCAAAAYTQPKRTEKGFILLRLLLRVFDGQRVASGGRCCGRDGLQEASPQHGLELNCQ